MGGRADRSGPTPVDGRETDRGAGVPSAGEAGPARTSIAPRSARHPLRVVMVIVALLMALSLDHGLPHRYIPDDTAVRCALGIARDVTAGEVSLAEALAPPAARYTTYPLLLPYLDLAGIGVVFAGGLATGRWGGPGAFKAAVFEDPTLAWLPARVVSVLLALLVPLAVARCVRELGRPRGEAAVAALLSGTSLLLVQYAHTARPWAPMLGLGMCAVALSLRLTRRRRTADLVGAFLAAALAASCFQVGLLFLAFPVVGWAWALLAARGERAAVARRGAVALVVAGIVIALVGYPHLLLHGDTGRGLQAEDTELLDDGATLEIGGQAFSGTRLGGARFRPVARSWAAYDPVLVVAGAAGLLLLLLGRRRGRALVFCVLPALCFAGVFLAYDGTHVRYLMPAGLLLAPGAARLLVALAAWGTPGAALAVLALAVPVVQAARLDLLLAREDTRTVAARDLVALTTPSDRIAVDDMGTQYGPPLLPRPEALAEVAAVDPEVVWLTRSEQRVLEAAEAGLPVHPDARALVPVSRFWRYLSYYPTDHLVGPAPVSFADWLEAWRIDVYVRVDRHPRHEPRAPVDELVASRGELLASWSPTGAPEPRAAELPTDMERALTDLWTYERPGPWIRAYRLRAETGR